jgi:hypothetical protein
MFRAITGKNAILAVVEAQRSNQVKYRKEVEDTVSVFPRRAEAFALLSYHRISERAGGDYLRLHLGLGFGWYEYWIGKIEWALGEELSARDWWVRSVQWSTLGEPRRRTATEEQQEHDKINASLNLDAVSFARSVAEPAALAALGGFYHHLWRTRGTESDRAAARNCYEAALAHYPKQRLAPQFLIEGDGDGAILLEAALPLLDILLDTAFIGQPDGTAAKPRGAGNDEEEEDSADGDENDASDDNASADDGAIRNRAAYKAAMNLLTQLSQARHHWALFKLGLCRMVRASYSGLSWVGGAVCANVTTSCSSNPTEEWRVRIGHRRSTELSAPRDE